MVAVGVRSADRHSSADQQRLGATRVVAITILTFLSLDRCHQHTYRPQPHPS